MFRTVHAVTEPDTDDLIVPTDNLIPLSVLQLDLAPHDGWELDLADVTVIAADVGPASVSRVDAARLIAAHRASQTRLTERLRRHRGAIDRQAIERD